jgi:hypothetical protein
LNLKRKVPLIVESQEVKLKGFLNDPCLPPVMPRRGRGEDNHKATDRDSKPSKVIADTFPEVTILFADIVGFTPWSSQREPAEVFILFQALYHHSFDSNARTFGVFKVETIAGECYVAATYLPQPQEDHAVRMARFATKCMLCMIDTTRRLEVRFRARYRRSKDESWSSRRPCYRRCSARHKVSSDECLNYARQNIKQRAIKGQEESKKG